MSARKQEVPKSPQAADSFPPRPQVEADLRAIRADINARFSNTLEYLGR